MSTEFGGDGQKVAEVSICRRCVRLWIGKSVILTWFWWKKRRNSDRSVIGSC